MKNIFTNTTPPACFARQRHGRRAFTLLETAIVIGILSLVLSGGLAMYRVQMVKERMDTTKARMDDIRKALTNYKLKNGGRLPCPASLTDSPTDPNFAKERSTCNVPPPPVVAGQPLLTDGTFRPTTTPTANKVRIGAVPVTTLGLSVEHMVDRWGRRFVYAVSENLASTGMPNYDAATYGGIQLKAPNGATLGPIVNQTPFVLLSMGKTGHGGYTYEGKPFGRPCPTADAQVKPEQTNCDFSDATFNTGNYSDAEADTNRFDDIVVNDLGNLSEIPADKIVVCSALGKFYSPVDLTRDSNDCVSGGVPSTAIAACSDKGMLYSPTNPNRDSNGCIYPAIPTNTQFLDADCKTATKNVVRYKGTILEICNGTTFAAVGGAGGGSSGVIVPKGTACPSGTVATSYNWVSKSCSTAAGNNYNSDACSSTSWSAGSCSTPSGWSGTATTCTYTISYNSSTMPKGRWGCCSAGCSPSYSSSSSQVVCTSVDYTQITCTPK